MLYGHGQALEVARRYQGSIHLLFSDMVMPHLSGPKIAEKLAASRPTMKVLFMTGYAGRDVLTAIQHPRALLQKPYTTVGLLQRVRQALDGG